jgi:Zn-dependent alcohol dehydrogenase
VKDSASPDNSNGAIGAVTASQGAPFEIRDLLVDDPRDDEIVVRMPHLSVKASICSCTSLFMFSLL